VDHAQAESYLRHLVETELGQSISAAAGNSQNSWSPAKLILIAQVLSATGAVATETTAEILSSAAVAAAGTQLNRGGLPQSHRALTSAIPTPARLLGRSAPESGTGAAGARDDTRHTALQQGGQARIFPVGKVVWEDDSHRELLLAAYFQSESSALFTMTGWPPTGPLTGVDDQGTSYRIGFRGRSAVGVLQLRPVPQREVRWLDLAAAPGKSATRIPLDSPDGPVPGWTVSRHERSTSSGEFLLYIIAAQILTVLADSGRDLSARSGPAKPNRLPHAPGFLGDIVAALNEAGALPAASPIPGQLARLCDILEITGHGIAMLPAKELPQRWQNMLRPDHRRDIPVPLTSPAAVVAKLPDVDGARITILGLLHDKHGTLLHTLHRDATLEEDWAYSRKISPLPLIWIHDSKDRWHTTRVSDSTLTGSPDEIFVWLQILPPLGPDISWIEVVLEGQSVEVHVKLPLHWE
jgi:hypothetical protein